MDHLIIHPNQGYIGNETFTYTAKDWKDTSEIGTVKIEVQDVNHAPLSTKHEFDHNH